MRLWTLTVVKGNYCAVLSFPKLADNECPAEKWTTCCVELAELVEMLNLPIGKPLWDLGFPRRKCCSPRETGSGIWKTLIYCLHFMSWVHVKPCVTLMFFVGTKSGLFSMP